mmetsp:Transcript_91650/g.258766  ORF Transcript_91650/g.258766 Transcript_91650/m.258766 type:complete len:1504 (-) Transcript_91650:57-4568(-)
MVDSPVQRKRRTVVTLRVSILSACGLQDADWKGRSDPYCTVEVEGRSGERARTETCKNSLAPEWNCEADVVDFEEDQTLVFKVWDADALTTEALGVAMLPGKRFMLSGSSGVVDLELADGGPTARLRVCVVVLPALAHEQPEADTATAVFEVSEPTSASSQQVRAIGAEEGVDSSPCGEGEAARQEGIATTSAEATAMREVEGTPSTEFVVGAQGERTVAVATSRASSARERNTDADEVVAKLVADDDMEQVGAEWKAEEETEENTTKTNADEEVDVAVTRRKADDGAHEVGARRTKDEGAEEAVGKIETDEDVLDASASRNPENQGEATARKMSDEAAEAIAAKSRARDEAEMAGAKREADADEDAKQRADLEGVASKKREEERTRQRAEEQNAKRKTKEEDEEASHRAVEDIAQESVKENKRNGIVGLDPFDFQDEQIEYFRVEVPKGKRGAIGRSQSRAVRWRHTRAKAYDFGVDTGDEVHELAGEELGIDLPDERAKVINERVPFRAKRVRCFNAGRHFPVLVNPRILPSYRPVIRAKRYSATREEPQEKPSQLMDSTVSLSRKRNDKKQPKTILPFIPSGCRRPARRIYCDPGGSTTDSYDAVREAHKQDSEESKRRCLHGDFLPNSARPKVTTPPPAPPPGQPPKSNSFRKFHRKLPQLSVMETRSRESKGEASLPGGTGHSSKSKLASSSQGSLFCSSDSMSTRPSAPIGSSAASQLEERRHEGRLGAEGKEARPMGSTPSGGVSKSSTGGSESQRSTLGGDASPSRRGMPREAGGSRNRKKNDSDSPSVSHALKMACGGDAIPISRNSNKNTLADQACDNRGVLGSLDVDSKAWTAFKRSSAGAGRLPKLRVRKAIEDMTLASPDLKLISEVWDARYPNAESLSFDEFVELQRAYFSRQQEVYWKAFQSFDGNSSGTIERSELQSLLVAIGVEPMKHVVDEVIREVDTDESGTLDYGEFKQVMRIIQSQEGFPKSEYVEFVDLFARFDVDRSGTMACKDVELALDWLGFKTNPEELDVILRAVDLDQSGCLDEREWLRCLRLFRDQLVDRLKDTMLRSDEDNDGVISYREIMGLLRQLGYVPHQEAVREALLEAGFSIEADFHLNELWQFLRMYRRRELLTTFDLNEVESCFNRYDQEQTGEVNVSSVGKMIRSMGYTLPFKVQQDLLLKVDIDGSGRFDLREFQKLIRIIAQRDLEVYRTTFDEALANREVTTMQRLEVQNARIHPGMSGREAHGPSISIDQAILALKRVGCVDSDGEVAEILPEDKITETSVDFYGFCQAATRSHDQARVAFKKNGGFAESELIDIQSKFKRYDEDGSGQISGKEIGAIVAKEFPLLSNDPKLRPEIVQLIDEADEDKNGALDFMDFVRIMRHVKDLQERFSIEKEFLAVAESRFSPLEVEEFRQLFSVTGRGSAEIGYDDVLGLLACIVPMGAKHAEQLKYHFFRHAARQMSVDGAEDMLDFPEFLVLMRELLDTNWANLAERTALLAERKK